MEFECLICGSECKLRKGKTVPGQLQEWKQECPKRMDEDGLSWLFSLDLSSLDRERCICRTCCALLSDLEGYESLAQGVRAELLQRHQASRQGLVLIDNGDPEDAEEERATPEPRRSGRHSDGGDLLAALRLSPVLNDKRPASTTGASEDVAIAAPAIVPPARGARRGRPPGRGIRGRGRGRGSVRGSSLRGSSLRGRGAAARGRRAAAAAAVEKISLVDRPDSEGEGVDREDSDGDDRMDSDGVAGADNDSDYVPEEQPPEPEVSADDRRLGVNMRAEQVEVLLHELPSGLLGAGAQHSPAPSPAGSEYVPSPAGSDRDDHDSSDPESDDPRDADYGPGPAPAPARTPGKKKAAAGSKAGKASPAKANSEESPDKRPYARRRGFHCSHCGLAFDTRASLVAHEGRSHRAAAGRNECAICRKSFKHRGSLITHQRMIHGPGEKCRHCDQVFRCHIEYYRHLSDAHDVRTHVCTQCGAGFAKRVLLNKHIRKCLRKIKQQQRLERLRVFKCSVCDYKPEMTHKIRTSTVFTMIRDHEHKEHGLHGALTDAAPVPAEGPAAAVEALDVITLTTAGEVAVPAVPEQRFPCGDCEKVFGCRRALLKHRYVHKPEVEPGPPPTMVFCEYCGKEFSSVYLKTHQAVVHKMADGDKFYKCKFCGKQYHSNQKPHYISHLQKKHLMNQEFPCTEPGCGRTFLHERGLKRHVQAIHLLAHMCGTCPERFGSLWKRDKHRAEAHGQYDFFCDRCGQKFFRRAELEIHVRRVHTLELKYPCSVCDTRSEERRKLLNHEYTAHGLHTLPLPANNPQGVTACRCPDPDCTLAFGCGLAVKQHAWDVHQMRLDIYGKLKIPLKKRPISTGGAAQSDVISSLLQRVTGSSAVSSSQESSNADPINLALGQTTNTDGASSALELPAAGSAGGMSMALHQSASAGGVNLSFQQAMAGGMNLSLQQAALGADMPMFSSLLGGRPLL